MSEPYQQFQLYAQGSCSTAGAKVCGGAKVTLGRTSAGLYTITCADAIAVAASVVFGAWLNTAAGQIQMVITSTTVFTVTTFAADGTTATDKAFSYFIQVVEP